MATVTEPRRILVVGDVMLDEYVWGTADRISAEAPVPIVLVEDTDDHLGGASNVARQVVALGGCAAVVGVIGDDTAGVRMAGHCGDAGIDASGLVVADDRPTTVKQRIVVGRHQIARLDREDARPLSGDLEQEVLARLTRAVRADAIVVSDYAKGVVTPTVLAAVMSLGQRWNVPVLVDPKHRDFGRYRGASVVKANLAEFSLAAETPADVVGDGVELVATFGPQVLAGAGVGALIVTLGAEGMVVLDDGGAPVAIAGTAREVFDVSGAGDTVIATLAILMSAGATLVEGAEIANLAAGLAVERRGVNVVTADELADALRPATPTPDRIATRDAVGALARVWRSEGRRIVFTNGCFDLLHAGHVQLLARAAELGDVLVVAVDTDASVRELKGDRRPIIGEHERMSIIGALAGVDAVVPFHHTELAALIDAVAPDVLVKGGDYVADEIVGAESVRARGGVVELVSLVDDVSTSALLDRIRDT